MAMFDIKDSKKVTLTDNETSGREFLKAWRVDDLEALRNKALEASSREKRGARWFRDNMLVAVGGAVLVAILTGLALYFWPSLKTFR